MLNYSETLENVYLAFNQRIGLKNEKFKNLVHLTCNEVYGRAKGCIFAL